MQVRNHSKKREAILAKIRSTKSHPTAEWVYRELKEDFPDLSLATVYRNIGLFREEGDVVCVGTVAGQERFDGNPIPHGHFVCRVCRVVIDIEGPDAQPKALASLKDMGLHADRIELIAYGSCNTCLEAR